MFLTDLALANASANYGSGIVVVEQRHFTTNTALRHPFHSDSMRVKPYLYEQRLHLRGRVRFTAATAFFRSLFIASHLIYVFARCFVPIDKAYDLNSIGHLQ